MSVSWRRVPVDLLVIVLTAVLTLPYLLVPYVVEDPVVPRISPQWSVVLTVAAGSALLLRRKAPLLVLGWTVACGGLHAFLVGEVGPAALPVMVALYALAVRAHRRVWGSAALVVAVVMIGVTTFANTDQWYRNLGTLFWVALPVAVAQAVRNRREFVAAMEERARRVELARAEEVRRLVMEERMRIARELHDVLAHSVAVVNVQSAVAAHVIDRDPAQAKQALGHISDASDAALSELRTTLDVLRLDDSPAPTSPLPGLGQVDELLANALSSGLDVRALVTGDPGLVPAEIGLVAYRILQEALTNVLKHARARSVSVRLEMSEGRVTVEVCDDGVGTAGPPAYGHGRIGMRERVHAVGGSLVDGPAAVGYRVSVTLPWAP